MGLWTLPGKLHVAQEGNADVHMIARKITVKNIILMNPWKGLKT